MSNTTTKTREIEPSERALEAARKLARLAVKTDGWMQVELEDLGDDRDGDFGSRHRESWEQTCYWKTLYGREISRIVDTQERRFGPGPLEFEQRYYGLYLPLLEAFWEEWEDKAGFWAAVKAAQNKPATVLESAAKLTGWDSDSQMAVCLDFVESHGGREAFAEYVKQRADADIAATAIK